MKIDGDEPGRVPEWLLERLASGDLPPAQARALADRVAREPDGEARLAHLAASNAEILDAHPPAAAAEAIRWRAAETARRAAAARPRGRARWLLGVPAMALGAALLALWFHPGTHPTEEDGERIKGRGAPGLRVYRKTAKSIERLPDGAVARAGDELQLAYVASGHRFGAVISLDGAGRVTFHLPEGGGRAAPLRAGGEVTLPESYQLDAAPRFERFLLVAGDAPFDTATLADVIRGAAPPPAGTEIIPFTVRKE